VAVFEKALNLLADAEVFASRAVGDVPGTFTDTCWALTVLVRYDKDAKAKFEMIIEADVFPEARLYALAGLFLVMSNHKEKYQPKHFTEAELKQPIHRQDGCVYAKDEWLTFGLALDCLSRADGKLYPGPGSYLIDDLPPLYKTTRVRRLPPEPAPKAR
jgi:hypothetical protein